LRWGVLCEVLVAVGVEDGRIWVADGQGLAVVLTVSVVFGTTVDGEVRSLVDKRPGLGIGTGFRSVPEGTAEVDASEIIGI